MKSNDWVRKLGPTQLRNQVERWFAFITDELIRRGSRTSVQALEADIRAWAKGWNEDPNRSSGPNPPNRSSSQSDDF